jgi:hypothetical protein
VKYNPIIIYRGINMTNQEKPRFLSREWFGVVIAAVIGNIKANLENPVSAMNSKEFVDAMKPKNK